jgi:predicted lipoprotein with Yx(FWY)xxD motif
MKWIITPALVAAAALAVSACGSSSHSTSTSTTSPAPAAKTGAVSVKRIDGLGSVLVNARGMALYTPEQEAGGKVLCTGGCTAIWQPQTSQAGKPKAPSGVGKLGVITRPNGVKQLTVDGRPLYSFVQDTPGKVTGNGIADAFAGQRFTWHAVLSGGALAGGSKSSGSSGGSTTTTKPGGGYGGNGY